jgi:hypothetical protein
MFRKLAVLLAGIVVLCRSATSVDATTVKSSDYTSDRMSGGGGKGTASRATTVKSGKPNTGDRMGGGGGIGIGGVGIGVPAR